VAESTPRSDYVVVMGALSDARFDKGQGLRIENFPPTWSSEVPFFLTRFEHRGFDARYGS
jgi:hypothetical protein